jgi:hypothetical protein
MDGDERPWIGRRVWIVDIKGRRHHGTLWWNNGATVHVRIDTPEVVLVPVAAQGERWGFIEDINPKSLRSR